MEDDGGGLALSHDMPAAPPVHIPDGNGGAYKTELVIERGGDAQVEYGPLRSHLKSAE
jgi:hypothetical protein